MAKSDSVEFFIRFLKERFGAFQQALSAFLQVLSLDDRKQKVESAKTLLIALDDIKRAISSNDRPAWIGPLDQKLNWYVNHHSQGDAGLQLLNIIIQLSPSIASQNWQFADALSSSAIDFAGIYNEYYAQSRVPELFDELVSHMESIIESGDIDSITTIKALERLIATIKRNARGDYFSTRGAWEFTQLFFKNLSIATLESIPGLKQAVKALRKTMSELDLEMTQVHDQVRQRLHTSVTGTMPMLEYKALGLPAPKSDTAESKDGG